jgi:hypothetical protein
MSRNGALDYDGPILKRRRLLRKQNLVSDIIGHIHIRTSCQLTSPDSAVDDISCGGRSSTRSSPVRVGQCSP